MNICVPPQLLPHKVNVESATLQRQGAGQQRKYPPEGGSTKYSNERCLVEPLATDKVVENMKLGFTATHRIYFGRKLTLVPTDRIVFGSRKFELKGDVDVLEQGILQIVDCEEVK